MIKKSQYVQLTLLILLIFALFLMTAASISFQGDAVSSSKEESGRLAAVTGASVNTLENPAEEDYAVIIQGKDPAAGENIAKQMESLKKEYQSYQSMQEVPVPVRDHMEQLILCSSEIEGYYSYDDIVAASMQGTDIIFAVLPSDEALTEEWMELLGIRYVGESYMQKGIVSLDNFFIGGIRWYKDYRIRTRRIKTNASCKTFIAAINDKVKQEKLRNEDATDIVWRKILNHSRLFAVNGNFFSDMEHIGILSAIFSRLDSDYLYPIVNAKMLFMEDAPFLSDENEDIMEERYARNAGRFLEEIAIPGIVSLSMALEIQPQFYGVSYFQDLSGGLHSDVASFLHRELVKIGGDIQVSAHQNDRNKTLRTIEMFERVTEQDVTSLFFGDYDEEKERQILEAVSEKGNISSVIHSWSGYPALSIEGDYAYIPMMTEGYDMDSTVMFRLDGAASALGLITHGISMEEMIYPESEEDDWATAYKDFSAYYYTACQKYSWLDGVDAAGLEQRVRQYLVMKPEITYQEDRIHLHVENLYTQGFFLLKTDKKIKKMSSGTFKKLEDGVYLLTVQEEDTKITLKEVRNF